MANKLASIISNIADLKLFELSYNHIQEYDFKIIINALKSIKSMNSFVIKSIYCFSASIIGRNNRISHLEISNCNFQCTMALTIIAKSIKEHRMLKQLCLNKNILTQNELSFALKEKSVLEHLSVSQCKLKEINIKLKTVDLSYNNITNKAANALKSLFSSPSIVYVDMSNCYLQEKGMLLIVNALKCKSLNYLNCSGKKISDNTATAISICISMNSCIEALDLSCYRLEEVSMVKILTSLKEHTSHLKSFKISSFTSNMETARTFEGVLERNKNIEILALQYCHCKQTFDAVRRIAASLLYLDIHSSKISFHNLISIIANNSNLKHLNISNCDVQDESDIVDNGFLGLIIEYLHLGRNKITKTFANFISNLLCVSYKLKHLDLGRCEMQESEVIVITNSMTALGNLNYLNFSSHIITPQVANNISKVISNNVCLKHLDISLCHFTEQTFSSIAHALKQLSTLKYFNINSCNISFDHVTTPSCYHESETSCDFDNIATEVNTETNLDFRPYTVPQANDEMFTFQDNDSSDSCDFDTRRYSFDKILELTSMNQSLNDPIILRATETTASSNFPMSTNAVDYNHMSINDFQEDENT